MQLIQNKFATGHVLPPTNQVKCSCNCMKTQCTIRGQTWLNWAFPTIIFFLRTNPSSCLANSDAHFLIKHCLKSLFSFSFSSHSHRPPPNLQVHPATPVLLQLPARSWPEYVFRNCLLHKLNASLLASTPMSLFPNQQVSFLMVESTVCILLRFPTACRMACSRGCVVAMKHCHSDPGLLPASTAILLNLPLRCTNTHIPAGRSQPRLSTAGYWCGLIPARCFPFSLGNLPHHSKRTPQGSTSFAEIKWITVLDACGTHLLPFQI